MSNQQAEKKFVDGLFIKTVETQYGGIDKLSFKVEQFIEFLKENQNDRGYVNIDILEKRDGGKYAKLDEFVPKPQGEAINDDRPDSTLPF